MPEAADKPAPLRRRRRRRWLRRTLASFGVLLLLLVVAVVVLLRNLHSPSVKRYLQGLARAQARIDFEYDAVDVSASGLRIDALVVQSPEAFRKTAPELLRVGSLALGWSRASLLGGGPKLNEVVVRDVEIAIVRDEDGRTSLDALSPPADPNTPAAPPAPPTPLSRILEEPLKNAPAVASVVIERVRVTLLQRNKNGEVVERWRLEGAGLAARAEREGKSWRLVTSAGAQKKPLELLITRDGAKKGEALARLWLDARATPVAAAAQLDVEIARQNLAPEVKLSRALHLEASARFDPAKKKTEIAITSTQLADGAATLEAAVEIPDGKPPLVIHAEGDLDLDRLIASLPEGVLPVAAKNARLRYKCDRLLLEGVPYFLEGGALSADGAIGELRAGPLEAREARLTVEALPAKDLSSTKLKAKIPVGSLRFGKQASGSGLNVSVEGRLTRALVFSGDVAVGFAQVALAAPQKISARDGRLAVAAADLAVDPAQPLAARGRVEVNGKIAALDYANADLRALVENAVITAQARLSGKAPYAIDAEIPVERVRLVDGKGKALLNGRSKIAVHTTDVWPDLQRPLRTRANAKVDLELDALKATIDARKHADAIEYEIAADAPGLAPARLLLAGIGEVPWEKVGLSLRAKGKIDRLASRPEIAHHSEVRLDRPSFKGEAGGFSAQSLTVVANGAGHARNFTGDVDVRTRALAVNKAKLGDGHVALKLAADAGAPSLKLNLDADGDGAPRGALAATLAFDRKKKLVRYDLDGKLGNLKPIAPLVGAVRALRFFDFSRLEVAVTGKGSFHGLVEAVGPDGQLTMAKDVLRTIAGDSTMEARVSYLEWENDAWLVSTPQAIWRGTLTSDGDRRTLRSELTASELHLASVDNLLDFEGINDTLELTASGDLRRAEAEMVHKLAVRHLAQDFLPDYPVGDVALTLKGSHDADGVIKVKELRLANPAAGTWLDLTGGVDLGERRRSLSAKGKLQQDLQRFSTAASSFSGKGAVSLTLAIDSGNLRVFHARAAVKVADAWLKLPRAKIEVDAAEGEVPLSADLVLDKQGLRLLRKATINAYSELRFADQHPLLSNRSFLSVQRISTPVATAGPVAGNLTIADNLVSLSQLEMGFKGGRITGQCLFNYDGEDSTMQLKVRASHIVASKGEEFDGNIAVLIDTGRRSVEGRAEILRIGRRHLLDLLDLHDPHQADVAVNRIRRALALGYPDRVRLAFNHGFAGVKVTFGGLASLVRIDELRGIPMGPIIDKVMARLKPREGEDS